MNKNQKTCFLCGKNAKIFAFIKLGHRIFKCQNCGLYSLDFEEDYRKFLNTYYSKGFFTGGKLYRAYADYAGDKATILKNMRKYLTVIKKHLSQKTKNKKTLLDLGCAMGFLIQEADKWGYDSYGIDVSSYAVEIAKKLVGKNKVFLGTAESMDNLLKNDASRNPSGFDVVTMFDLIEHLEKPKIVLEKVAKVLNPSGILVIQTGDAGSSWAKFMGKNWHFFAPPQHFYFYSRKNMEELLKQTGFGIVKIQKVGKWVSLRYLFHMMRYVNKDTIGDILYNFTAKNILGQIPLFMRMNDNMIVIAKKTS